ncbi:glycoside hydrolase family 3 C-terminal domain-containing protein, partial [Salinispira pacifica]
LFEHPYAEEDPVELHTPEHLAVAREAARKSIVLLKNDGVLPLAAGSTIALVGPLADERLGMLGGYSFPVHLVAARVEGARGLRATLKEALEARDRSHVIYRRGCDILHSRPDEPAVFPGELSSGGRAPKSYVSCDESMIPDAVEAARAADVVILAAGDLAGLFLSGTVGEGSDTSSLDLPGVQPKLLDALLDTGKPVILLLSSGRPYCIGRGSSDAAAVLSAGLPGEEGPEAIVDVLYGDASPGGRLPVSMPKSAGAMPYFYNHAMKAPGTPVQVDFGAVYPFGFGLSYTSFDLSEFELDHDAVSADGDITLHCLVENTGPRTGDEVVQIYIRDLYASRVRPILELKAYRRVTLKPGESAKISFAIPCDMLGFTGAEGRRIVEPGEFELALGTSSRDILFRTIFTVTGKVRALGESWRMKSSTRVEHLRATPIL